MPQRRAAFVIGAIVLLALVAGGVVIANRPTSAPPAPSKIQNTPLLLSTPIGSLTARSDQVILYETTPGAQKSAFQVKVNKQDLFVEHYKDVDYARFAFAGTVSVLVIPPVQIANYRISPKRYQIAATVGADNSLNFSLSQPQKLILQFGSEKLFLLADAPEQNPPRLGDANVIDVTQYAKDSSGNAIQTTQIQQAIDAASAKHAIVYFPSGTYLSGTLDVKSNVSLYLSSGALLKGTGRLEDYTHGHFLWFNNSNHAKLYGRGVIDLQGSLLRRQNDNLGRVKLIRTLQATDITLQDLLVRDSGSWTVHIVDSDRVIVSNLKLINDMNTTNNDGIDPDNSSDVTIDSAFIYTGDDCFAVKTSSNYGTPRDSRNILIKNAVCYDKKSALKVGTETRANLSNITFMDDTVVHADRAIALYMADGSTLAQVSYLNTSSEEIGGDAKQRLIDMNITDRRGIGDIQGVVITNYLAEQAGPNDSAIAGMPGHSINVMIKNMRIAGRAVSTLADAKINVKNATVLFQ